MRCQPCRWRVGAVPGALGSLAGMDMVIGPRSGPVDQSDLAWAYPWPDAPRWIRAMMLTTLDGAAYGNDGASGSISSKADRAVFNVTRRLADAALIGAGTMRVERYRPMKAKPELADQRASLGLAAAPGLVLVSQSLDIPWEEDVFSQSTITPIVVTSESADPDRLAVARDRCDVIALPGERVDPVALIDALEERGLHRIVCEGGPHLLRELSAAGLVDEADISVAPMIAGGGQIVTGVALESPLKFELVHAIEHEGFLFNRYVANGRGVPA